MCVGSWYWVTNKTLLTVTKTHKYPHLPPPLPRPQTSIFWERPSSWSQIRSDTWRSETSVKTSKLLTALQVKSCGFNVELKTLILQVTFKTYMLINTSCVPKWTATKYSVWYKYISVYCRCLFVCFFLLKLIWVLGRQLHTPDYTWADK